jgi:hypothetical protein
VDEVGKTVGLLMVETEERTLVKAEDHEDMKATAGKRLMGNYSR